MKLRSILRSLPTVIRFAGLPRGPLVLVFGLGVLSGLLQATVIGAILTLVLTSDGGSSPVPFVGADVTQSTLLAVASVAAVLMLIVDITVAWIATRASAEVLVSARQRVLGAFFGGSWPAQVAERDGAVQDYVITHVNQLANSFVVLTAGLVAAANLLALWSAALVVSLGGALVLVAVIGGLFVAFRPLTRAIRARTERLATNARTYGEDVAELTNLAMEVRVFAAGPYFEQNLTERNRAVARDFAAARFFERIGGSLFRQAALLVVLAMIGLALLLGADELGGLGVTLVFLVRAGSYAQGLQGALNQLAGLLPYAEQLMTFEARLATQEHGQQEGTGAAVDVFDSIRLADVAYLYPEMLAAAAIEPGGGQQARAQHGQEVLAGVDLELKAGETVGIVGPSGSGKTTLVELLLRLRVPTRGRFSIDDVPASEVAEASWYRMVGYVSQHPKLISGTVADNVVFGRPSIAKDEVRWALEAAGLGAELHRGELGLDTVIGPRSTGLSGGQRQRLCIARALVGRPQLLVLDEPTSALDRDSEGAVVATLEDLKGTTTMVIVSHRPAALRPCDRVIELRR